MVKRSDLSKRKLNFYDIYGYVIAVDDSANEVFQKEYGYFAIDEDRTKIDLYVINARDSSEEKMFPTKPTSITKDLFHLIPFDEGNAHAYEILVYNPYLDVHGSLDYITALLWWSDKTVLHAGAVLKNGNTFVFTGEGNVGKTSLVLNFIRRGYKYLSDDWLIVGQGKAYPFPKKIHVFGYNLKDKEIAKSVLGLKRFYYGFIFKLLNFGRGNAPHRYLRYACEALMPIFYVDIQTLHTRAEIGTVTGISKIFYLERWDENRFDIQQNVDPAFLAKKMAYVNMHEMNYLFEEYFKSAFRFGIQNEKLESRLHHDYQILYEAFKKTSIFRVRIPRHLDLTKIDPKTFLGVD